MSVAKTIEINASSERGFKHAIEKGIARAAATVDGISGAWVSEQKVVVDNGEVTAYRVTLRVTFVLSEDD